jgi:phosphoglycerate kinase
MSAETAFEASVILDRTVLVRVDHNVPLDSSGAIVNDYRIRLTVPVIGELARKARKVILLAHLGYPRGRRVHALTTQPLAHRLGQLLGMPVSHAPSAEPRELCRQIAASPERIVYAENVRFLEGEEHNENSLAQGWAKLAAIYINDAFSVSHRPHASVAAIANHAWSLAGPTLATERRAIVEALDAPQPRALICGGAKYVDKLRSTSDVAHRFDFVAFGGVCAIVVALMTGALPASTGMGLADAFPAVGPLLMLPGVRLLIPSDWIVATGDGSYAVVSGTDVTDAKGIIDIGPRSVACIEAVLGQCQSALWVGPMGRYEIAPGRAATRRLIEALAHLITRGGRCVYGGGDTVAAKAICLSEADCGFAASSGGALLAFLAEQDALPGLAPLARRVLRL